MVSRKKLAASLIPIGIMMGLSFFFFSFKESSAATIASQPIFDTVEYVGDNFITQTLGTLPSGTIKYGSLWVVATSTNIQPISIGIYSCTGTYPEPRIGSCTGAEMLAATTSLVTVPDNFQGVLDFVFNNATTTNPNQTYALFVNPNFGAQNEISGLRGSVTNTYINGECGKNLSVTGDLCQEVKDIFFSLTSTGNTINLDANIVFELPVHTAITPDFSQFMGTFSDATSTIENPFSDEVLLYTVGIFYGQASTSLEFTDVGVQTSYGGAGFQYYPWTVDKTNTLTAGIWYAKANLYDPYFTLRATTSIISFTVGESGNPLIPGENFATTTGSFYDQCQQLNVNGWQNAVCNLLSFLFQPHDFSINAIKSVLTGFQKVFPFSLVYQLQQNTIDFALTGTSTAPLSIVFKTPVGTTSVDILTATLLTDRGLTDTKNRYFQITEMLIWIACGLGLFKLATDEVAKIKRK